MNTANLRRLLDEATPRPWDGRHIFDGENVIQHGHDVFRCHVAITQTEVDMDLIVELVNNADELLAENERLRAVVRAAKKFVEHVDSGCGRQCASCRNDDEDCDCGYIELIGAFEALEQT